MLEDLEARWRDERTPQAGVRLAEALLQQGDTERAEGVLTAVQRRLESEPRDLASRVAVGGLRRVLGQDREAAEALEEVVQADPTHLRANKLLIEVYLDLGNRELARDRLDLYRLLNQGDPEIEALEALVVGVAAEEAAAASGEDGRRLRTAGGDPFAELAAEIPEAPVDDLFGELMPPPEPLVATATLGELYQAQGHHEEAEKVFRDVITREPDNQRAHEGLVALAEPQPTPPSAAAPSVGEPPVTDRERRIGILREYLTRIQRGREGVAR